MGADTGRLIFPRRKEFHHIRHPRKKIRKPANFLLYRQAAFAYNISVNANPDA
jgi:hypothetical protein